ncbi:hypothetical protein EU538_11805, partial [Candidatus Thorarchaeota archaeon]
SDGSLNWEYAFPGGCSEESRPSIADVDADGIKEVVMVANDTSLYCIDGISGTPDWSYPTGRSIRGSGCITDLDGDRKLEVIFAVASSSDGWLYIINGEDGSMEWSEHLLSRNMYSTPAVADIDQDGRKEILIITAEILSSCEYSYAQSDWPYYDWPAIVPAGDIRGTGCFVDTDRDNLTDTFEVTAGCDPHVTDTDLDNGNDYEEFLLSMNPTDGIFPFRETEWKTVLPTRWDDPFNTGMGGVTVADIDGQEGLEMIACGINYTFCLSGTTGAQIWNFTTPTKYYIVESAIADVNADGIEEVLFAGFNSTPGGVLYCLNGTNGKEMWNYTVDDVTFGGPAVQDVDSDGVAEVFFGDWTHQVYCLNGMTGAKIWNYTVDGLLFAGPLIIDLDGDSNLEVVVGTGDSLLYCLDALTGEEKWNFTGSDGLMFDPSICDINQDGALEIIVAAYTDGVQCIHGTNGTLFWEETVTRPRGAPVVGDADNDGEPEILVGSQDSALYCLNSTGGVEWYFTTPALVENTPCLADVDGDESTEVLFSQGGHLYCLSGAGEEEWNMYWPLSAIRGPVVVTDLDADNQLEIAIALDHPAFPIDQGLDIISLSINSAPYVPHAYPWPGIERCCSPAHTRYYADQDGDGLSDMYELAAHSPPDSADVDTDGLSDSEEFYGSTDPRVDDVVPGMVNDLSVSDPTPTTASLTWTAPGDNAYSGTVAAYELRYSTNGPIENEMDWQAATIYTQSWTPVGVNSTESHIVTELPSLTELWFAVRALDEQDNLGGLSNSPGIQTLEFFPPSTISDLAALNATTSSLMLTWTAPGDDGMSGTADGYILKHSVAGPITTENWGSATTYSQSWNPGSPGSSEVREITGLLNATRYWFAIRAYDDVGNYGGVSNSPNLETLEGVRPGAPTDLVVTSVTQTTVTLSWTAPGDNGTVGTAAGYIIKYSTSGQITSENWMNATEYMQDWTPLEAGETESHTLSDLAPDTTYWFAIMAYDDIPNYGELSESVLETTLEAVPPAMIGDLIVVDMNSSSITLNWTAPGDNGMSGRAAGYVVKYSVIGPITSENWESATTYDQSWDPHSAGHMENHAVLGLEEGANYWFTIVAYDEVGNYGEVSNTALGTTTIAGGFPAGFGSGLAIGIVAGAGSLAAVIVVVWLIRKKRGT